MNATTADTIRAALAESPYQWHGLRVVDAADEAVIGVELAASRVWDDGGPTDDTLPGTSAVDLRVGVGRALRLTSVYEGRFLLVIGSDRNANDVCDLADDAETVLIDPVVLAVIERG